MVRAHPLTQGVGTTIRGITRRGETATLEAGVEWALGPRGYVLDLPTEIETLGFGYTTQSLPMSAMVWFNTDFQDEFRPVWGNWNSTNDDLYFGPDGSGTITFAHDAGSGGTTGGSYTQGTWHSAAMALDGERKRGYVDGVEVVNVADTTTTDVDNGAEFALGQSNASSTAYHGQAGQVFHWDRGITAAEVAALHENPLLPYIVKPR